MISKKRDMSEISFFTFFLNNKEIFVVKISIKIELIKNFQRVPFIKFR